MKKMILFVVLALMSTMVYADGLTATLQQGEKMTPFYGVDAFKQAYQAADSGAVITLSAGTFNTTNIAKSITVVGSYAFKASSPEVTILEETTVSANNVKIEGIYFPGNVTLDSIYNCHIKRCWVEKYLTSTKTHTNTLIDQCVVKTDKAVKNGRNYCIQNSTLYSFGAENTTNNIAYITNCVIWYWFGSGYVPFAIYKNNMLAANSASSPTYSVSVYSEYHNNIFINSYNSTKYNYTITIKFPDGCVHSGNIDGKTWSTYYTDKTYPAPQIKSGVSAVGQDGTPIGIYGGIGFSEYPSIPRIVSKEIDSSTNAEGKINVKVKVKVQQ